MDSNNNEGLLLTESKTVWFQTKYASPESRLILLFDYNNIVGPPSESVARVQDDFINARMAPEELVNFIITCKSIISAANRDLE